MPSVMQARFPGMKCTKCNGEIIVEQDMIQDMDQFGPQGGKRYMHANPAECRAPRRNPKRGSRSQSKTVSRRNPPASMHEKDLRRRNFKGKKLRGAQMWRSNLSGVDLSNADLAQAAIWESDLSGANLSGADLRHAQLNGSNLRKANLRHAKMYDTNIDGADLSGADLRGTDLSDVMFPENARFMDAVYDENTEWPWSIEDPEMQVGARHQYTMVLNPQRRNNPARRARKNPSTSTKLEALAKKYGTRTKAGKLAMAIAKDLRRQGE